MSKTDDEMKDVGAVSELHAPSGQTLEDG